MKKTIMKSLKNILGISAVALMGFAMASCVDKNDWDVDSSYSRLFAVNGDGVSVTTTESTATVTFTTVPDAEYYIFQVSKDSLYDDMEVDSSVKTYGEDQSLTTSPVVLDSLDGDSKYYLRIKAYSSTLSESRWSYYDDGGTFSTKAEQIFNDVESSDLYDSYVTVTWTAGLAVTHIVVTKSDDSESWTVELTDEEIEEGSCTITGLSATSTYSVVIYNNDVKRGTLTITTPAAVPSADYRYYLDESVTNLSQDLLDEIAELAIAETGESSNYSVTIAINGGQELYVHGTSDTDGSDTNVTIPDGMSVTFFGLSGGDAPILYMTKNFDIAGSHSFITFQNLKFIEDGALYMINQSNACTVGEFTYEDCEFEGISRSIFRMQNSSYAKSIETLNVTNCIFTDMCTNGYSFIHVDTSGAGIINNINVTSCTLDGVCPTGKMFIYHKSADMSGDIVVSDCTFYYCFGSSNYFIDFGSTDYGCNSITISNCIFAKQPDENSTKGVRSSVTTTYSNSYATSDFYNTKLSGLTWLEYTSEELFTDPENGDFTIQSGTLKEEAGDPRWYTTE